MQGAFPCPTKICRHFVLLSCSYHTTSRAAMPLRRHNSAIRKMYPSLLKCSPLLSEIRAICQNERVTGEGRLEAEIIECCSTGPRATYKDICPEACREEIKC